jgi:hypothetical protein
MKKITIILTVMAFAGLIFADSSLAGRIGKRHFRQRERIHQGLKSKELTKRETRALVHEQHRIQRTQKKALNDGVLTPKERARIEIQQHKASRDIYRLKHNDRTR